MEKISLLISLLFFFVISINAEKQGQDDGHNTHDVEKEWYFGVRIGLSYDFHIGRLSTCPSVNADIANTTVMGYGLAIGLGF